MNDLSSDRNTTTPVYSSDFTGTRLQPARTSPTTETPYRTLPSTHSSQNDSEDSTAVFMTSDATQNVESSTDPLVHVQKRAIASNDAEITTANSTDGITSSTEYTTEEMASTTEYDTTMYTGGPYSRLSPSSGRPDITTDRPLTTTGRPRTTTTPRSRPRPTSRPGRTASGECNHLFLSEPYFSFW